ncbi:MAG TPA: TonB-dependent receptor [Hyphomonas sp.]|nr:TonB-dependent receptor [Hyphomonas sp.]
MKTFKGMLLCASAVALGGTMAAHAQEDSERKLERVTVTGSFIQGTPEDAALPVDVLTAEDLRLQGNPSALDMIKSLPISHGVLGDTNQFDGRAQGSEGSGTVNLRGLGASRTLVLLDGKRLAPNPFAFAGNGSVDTNILPMAAVGRIEILKDGAAATYGSDAVAGVVNFITRTDFEGFEVGGDYKFVDGSDGDYTLKAVGGITTDFGNFMLAAGYQHRSELATTERDWALRDFLGNPQGGWSLVGNPGSFLPVGGAFTPVQGVTRDPACGTFAGTPVVSGANALCSFQFTPFDNIVEEENRYQILGKADFDLSDKHTLSLQAFYAATEVPQIAFSPSFPPVGGASAPTADASLIPGQFFVPITNPGFATLIAQNPGYVSPAAVGAYLIATRPLGYAGNALAGGRGSERSYREYEHYRLSAELKGELTEAINYTASFTTGSQTGRRTNEDTVVNRYALALRGLGGTNCNVAANTPGLNGCLWFNPFSNAIQTNVVTGATNPNYNPAAANSLEVLDFMLEDTFTEQEIKLTVIEGVLDGRLPITFAGGQVGWAFGGQYREEEFDRQYNDIANLNVTPCIATVTTGATNCAEPVGALGFLAGSRPLNASQDIFAIFGELSLPFTENFNAQLAARYEDYGGDIGSTFDPKLSLRWQVADPFALRASVGTTFRGPALTQVAPGSVTSLQNVGGTFRAVDIAGNPGLAPESALTYNIGAIFKPGNLNFIIDYWSFDFDDSVITEPVAPMVAAMFPGGSAVNCGNPTFAGLQARFTFTGPCAIGNVSRLSTSYINGPNIKTSGIDVQADYTFEDVLRDGMDLKLGFSGSQVLEYEVGQVTVEGLTVGQPFSAVGFLNFQTVATPLPELKFEAYANASTENMNARVTARYIGEYEDQRTALFTAPNANWPVPGVILPQGQTIKSFVSYDATLVWQLPAETTLSFSVDNILDTKPPFARLELNYDPFTGDAIGRTFKVGITKRFGAQ